VKFSKTEFNQNLSNCCANQIQTGRKAKKHELPIICSFYEPGTQKEITGLNEINA
jgi:hypothetical protein